MAIVSRSVGSEGEEFRRLCARVTLLRALVGPLRGLDDALCTLSNLALLELPPPWHRKILRPSSGKCDTSNRRFAGVDDGPVAGEGSVEPIWYDGPAAMLRMPIVILFVSASGDRV
jgi:hypothetical protein